jgi:hypothetical protein
MIADIDFKGARLPCRAIRAVDNNTMLPRKIAFDKKRDNSKPKGSKY